MNRISAILFLCFSALMVHAQDMASKLDKAFKQMVAKERYAYASVGFYVQNKNGQKLYSYNENVGLATASTLKTITAISAYELLGSDYKFKTDISYTGSIINKTLKGNLVLHGFGDPSFGSWRWDSTSTDKINNRIEKALKDLGINQIDGNILIDNMNWGLQPTPDGWIWQDLGNYYGAGAMAFNWNENQYTIYLRSSANVGSPVEITKTSPVDYKSKIESLITAGPAGSGDQAYVYAPPFASRIYATGTIPISQSNFSIAAAMPNAAAAYGAVLKSFLETKGIAVLGEALSTDAFNNYVLAPETPLITIYSPSLKELNGQFLKKSINLYGEAFVKAIAYKSGKIGTDAGVNILQQYWASKGIPKAALNIMDGSGLSPANRVTPKAMGDILLYAQKRPWYPEFYSLLNVRNGHKLKDGYINGVRSFAGYSGDYIFVIIANNFSGEASNVTTDMLSVLSVLNSK